MVDLEKAVVAKLKKGGKVFEVLVDCENALAYRQGKDVEWSDVIVTDDIFSDVKKGIRASEHDMERLFGSSDKDEIAKRIVKEGVVALSADYLRKEAERKRKQIIDLIARNAVDPKTGRPHPPQRIEAAMDEVKVRIDDRKSAEAQVQDVVRKIGVVLPIKYELRVLLVKIPVQYSGKVYNVLRQFGKVVKEEWKEDGLIVGVEVPAGLQEGFESQLNAVTHGNVDIKIVERK